MTTPLELKPCPFCGGEADSDSARNYRNISTGTPEKAAAIYCTKCSADMTWCYRDTPEIERDHVMKLLIEQWNTRATASLQGEDAVERVALRHTVLDILNSVAPAVENLACNQEQADADGCMVKVSRQAVDEVLAAVNEVAIQAATATGLVAGEAAIRAAERERCAGPDLLAVMEKECWTLRCVDIPTGGGDADVAWDVVSHHMAKPHDRVIATGNTPIKALAAAIRAGGE